MLAVVVEVVLLIGGDDDDDDDNDCDDHGQIVTLANLHCKLLFSCDDVRKSNDNVGK